IRKKITLVKNIDEGLTIETEPEMLKAVIRNLLNNAVKFTPENKAVTITVERSDKEISICVEDQGVGISKENINRLFKLDQTFTTLGTKNEKGSGLGLLITNDFIKRMDGTLEVKSEIGK